MDKERYDPPMLETWEFSGLHLLDSMSFTDIQEGGFTGVTEGGELPEEFNW